MKPVEVGQLFIFNVDMHINWSRGQNGRLSRPPVKEGSVSVITDRFEIPYGEDGQIWAVAFLTPVGIRCALEETFHAYVKRGYASLLDAVGD